MSEFKQYVKRPIPIQAKQMDAVFSVETKEGTMTGKAGDYLIIGMASYSMTPSQAAFLKGDDKKDGAPYGNRTPLRCGRGAA